MNTKQLMVIQTYVDETMENNLKEYEEAMRLKMEIQAKFDGQENKPSNFQYLKVQALNPIATGIQALLDKNNERNQPVATMAYTQSIRAKADDDVKTLNFKANNAQRKYEALEQEQKRVRPSLAKKISRYINYPITISFALAEFLMTWTLAAVTSSSLIQSLAISLIVALISGFGIYVSAGFIRKANSKKETIKRYLLVLSIAAIVCIGLGSWRAVMNGEINDANAQLSGTTTIVSTTSASPIFYAILSFIAFIVCLALEIKFYQTEADKRKQREGDFKEREVKETKAEWLAYEEAKKQILAETTEVSGIALHRHEYGKAFEQRLITLADELRSYYESTNLNFRKDGQCPTFFGEATDWQFKLYFIKFFNNENQQS